MSQPQFLSPPLIALCVIVILSLSIVPYADATGSGAEMFVEDDEQTRFLQSVTGGRNYTELYEKAINDERNNLETVSTSLLGATIPRICGTMSAICSFLIIFIILRSTIGLSTTYHRLLFGLSVAETMYSIGIALSTLPMPKDMLYDQFVGRHIGNTDTCTIQGFVVFYFSSVALGYNIVLCVYYLFSIRYKMSEAHIRKRVEPWLHCLAILTLLPPSVMLILTKVSCCRVDIYMPVTVIQVTAMYVYVYVWLTSYSPSCHHDTELQPITIGIMVCSFALPMVLYCPG